MLDLYIRHAERPRIKIVSQQNVSSANAKMTYNGANTQRWSYVIWPWNISEKGQQQQKQ